MYKRQSHVPEPCTQAHVEAVGELAFFTALGVPDNGFDNTPLRRIDPLQHRGKASDNGWSSCASCHPDGLADGVTWSFPTGPRQTVPLDGFFAKEDDSDQRISNWSAVRGSITDFNNNARNIQGGLGFAGDPPPATIFNHGITQGASDSLDAMTDWVKTVRTLDMPDIEDPFTLANGLFVFGTNCASCHGGPKWTKSTVVYQDNPAFDGNPLAGGLPLDPGITNAGPQIVSFMSAAGTLQVLDDVGTFDPLNPAEIRGAGGAIGQTAVGGLGFNAPSLLGVGASAPYFHNGAAQDLPAVWVQHLLPSTGVSIAASLTPQQLVDVALFVRSIDGDTITFGSDADPFLP